MYLLKTMRNSDILMKSEEDKLTNEIIIITMVRDSLSSSLGGMMITGITIIIIIIGKEMATMKEGINTLKSMLKIVLN